MYNLDEKSRKLYVCI